MIGGPNPSIANLSSIYTANNLAIALAMTRIASGKRVQNPGDDFAGYAKASSLQSDIDQYETIKQNLQDANGLSDYAEQVGDTVVTNLNSLQELKTLYASSIALDTDAGNASAASYKAQYAAAYLEMNDTINAAYYVDANGVSINVYQSGVNLATVKINPEGNTISINASAIANIAAVDDIANTSQNIAAEIINAELYSATMNSAGSLMQSQMKLTDTIISSNQATISVITDIDEAAETSLLTSLQVRQQATVAMMAQANIAQGYAAILYGAKPQE